MTDDEGVDERRAVAIARLQEHPDRIERLAAAADISIEQATNVLVDAVASLTPDDEGVVMFPPEVVESIARMDAARQRLRSLGVKHTDLGRCEHGWVAGTVVQRGRAHRDVIAHGAPSPAQALEQLAIEIDKLPADKPRRRHKRSRR